MKPQTTQEAIDTKTGQCFCMETRLSKGLVCLLTPLTLDRATLLSQCWWQRAKKGSATSWKDKRRKWRRHKSRNLLEHNAATSTLSTARRITTKHKDSAKKTCWNHPHYKSPYLNGARKVFSLHVKSPLVSWQSSFGVAKKISVKISIGHKLWHTTTKP